MPDVFQTAILDFRNLRLVVPSAHSKTVRKTKGGKQNKMNSEETWSVF